MITTHFPTIMVVTPGVQQGRDLDAALRRFDRDYPRLECVVTTRFASCDPHRRASETPVGVGLERTDNRLTNLRLLCPNCDSQTATFAGRNKKKRAL